MEAVKQGGATLGLRSGSHVVLAALKRTPNEMSAPQKKIFKLDSTMGIAIAGLTADARSLAKYMRTECLNHKWVFHVCCGVLLLCNEHKIGYNGCPLYACIYVCMYMFVSLLRHVVLAFC